MWNILKFMHDNIKKRKDGIQNDYFEQDASRDTQDWPLWLEERTNDFELTRTKKQKVCKKAFEIMDSVVIKNCLNLPSFFHVHCIICDVAALSSVHKIFSNVRLQPLSRR